MNDFQTLLNNQMQSSNTIMAPFTTREIEVQSTDTLVSSSKSDRLLLIFQNDSNKDIYLNFGVEATSEHGLRLRANNVSLIILDRILPTNEIHAICSNGTALLTLIEA